MREFTRDDLIHAKALVEAFDGDTTQIQQLIALAVACRDLLDGMIERMKPAMGDE